MVSKTAYQQRLQQLLYLLRHKQAGTAAAITIKLNCSTRTVKNCINKLRQDGFKIEFDKSLKRYVLKEE